MFPIGFLRRSLNETPVLRGPAFVRADHQSLPLHNARCWPRVKARTLEMSTSVGQMPSGEPLAMLPALCCAQAKPAPCVAQKAAWANS